MQRRVKFVKLMSAAMPALLLAIVLVLATTGTQRIAVAVAHNEQPTTALSSTSATRSVASETTTPHIAGAPLAELDTMLFVPAIFNPELLSAYAQQVVELTNNERARAGCPPLRVNLQLVAAAQGHSEDMAFNDFFSHTGSDGSSPWDRMADAGYQWREAGENIAAGYTSPQSVMNGWMNSEGHRNNILNCSFEEIGVGYIYLQNDIGDVNYRHYWTQLFARPT